MKWLSLSKPVSRDKGAGFIPAQPLHVLEANRPRTSHDDTRRRQTGRLRG